MAQKTPQCFIHSLPTETVYIILKTLLDDIVEDDMMRTPDAKHRVLAGGLPFPHTMALVCRHWRDIVSSAPELWTRVFCVLPQEELQWMSSQLQKSASYPVHLTIIHQHDIVCGIYPILSLIAPHLQRLKSLRIHEFHEAYVHNHLDMLTGHAPQLEFLRLTDVKRVNCFKTQPCLKLDCPALRILHIDKNAVCDTNHQWLKKNLTHVDHMSISFGSGPPTATYRWSGFPMLARALKVAPRRIPCLSLENLLLPVNISQAGVKIGAAKVILRTRIDALAVIDDDCQTVVLRQCNFVRHLSRISLPSFNSLELDGCASKALQDIPRICTWDGNTVTVTNSRRSCMKIILYFLGAPFKRQRCSL
ncbi:hypothetical protein F4604DRAFT_965772 [Suillus subluteus]|nr:hypothetical protein F4604DRAFT_965772 [Suillus subluteus]